MNLENLCIEKIKKGFMYIKFINKLSKHNIFLNDNEFIY
jgi:hypothetical protein